MSARKMNKAQNSILEELGLPSDFSGLDDDAMIAIEDALHREMMSRGVNAAGDGLNDYGELVRSVIVSLPDE